MCFCKKSLNMCKIRTQFFDLRRIRLGIPFAQGGKKVRELAPKFSKFLMTVEEKQHRLFGQFHLFKNLFHFVLYGSEIKKMLEVFCGHESFCFAAWRVFL